MSKPVVVMMELLYISGGVFPERVRHRIVAPPSSTLCTRRCRCLLHLSVIVFITLTPSMCCLINSIQHCFSIAVPWKPPKDSANGVEGFCRIESRNGDLTTFAATTRSIFWDLKCILNAFVALVELTELPQPP